jgi:hypothetical protein
MFPKFYQRILTNFFLVIVLISFTSTSVACQSNKKGKESDSKEKTSFPKGKTKKPITGHPFALCYPEYIDSVSGEVIYWTDGTKMPLRKNGANKIPYSEMGKEEYEDALNNADPFSMLSPEYPYLKAISPPTKNFDPGRFRDAEFLKKVYGGSKKEVEKNLKRIVWQRNNGKIILSVNKNNGAADSLQKIADELDKLPEKFQKYLKNPAGTYMWRNIAGTKQLSAHSFGIAIDINVSQSHYWRSYYKKGNDNISYKNFIPQEIVFIFEKHGWIWGGRWYHFDTMHFEYRPEIIESSKRK